MNRAEGKGFRWNSTKYTNNASFNNSGDQPPPSHNAEPGLYLDDGDVRLYLGDALETVRAMPDESVDCVVTSPPYWGLRCYGVDGQMGLEETPDLFVAGMVELFREIRRVLAPHGTCWVNLGDSYAGSGPTNNGSDATTINRPAAAKDRTKQVGTRGTPLGGLKPKDLVGIPWRVAFALQADGWWLRSDIIWAKPNPMPESVTDRPTKAHEYVFLLTKQPRYFFDTEAVREPHTPDNRKDTTVQQGNGSIQHRNGERWPNAGRNVRSVWKIATQPYPEAHFATFPEELARRCILAGCPTRVCRVCGKPSERIVETTYVPHGESAKSGGDFAGDRGSNHGPERMTHGKLRPQEMPHGRATRVDTTAGWTECDCLDPCPGHGPEDYCLLPCPDAPSRWRPGVVLDPFIGSGTVAKVARDHQRHAIGIDLNETYLELAARRLQQLSLLT